MAARPFIPSVIQGAASAVVKGWPEPKIRKTYGLTAEKWAQLRAEPQFAEAMEMFIELLEREQKDWDELIRPAAWRAVQEDVNDPESKSRAVTARWYLDRNVYHEQATDAATLRVEVDLSPQAKAVLNDRLPVYDVIAKDGVYEVESSPHLLTEGEKPHAP